MFRQRRAVREEFADRVVDSPEDRLQLVTDLARRPSNGFAQGLSVPAREEQLVPRRLRIACVVADVFLQPGQYGVGKVRDLRAERHLKPSIELEPMTPSLP